jgi:hypothetical protein
MTVPRLLAVLFIFICTAFAWFLLGGALDFRTRQSDLSMNNAVSGAWGPSMVQQQPSAYYQSPGVKDGRALLRPAQSKVDMTLQYEPKRKGLLWYRTYLAGFRGEYTCENPTPIPQTIFVTFCLPAAEASYNQFSFTLNGKPTTANVSGRAPITEAVVLQPNEKAVLAVAYKTRGLDRWSYSFGTDSRVQNFTLQLKTNFDDIDFPAGTGSPSERVRDDAGWNLTWSYPDEIGARGIGMDMPKVLNPGPTASRIIFFAPVSLLFFFASLVILCLLMKVDMHPMNFFFLSAGCFAFQLLFAYLVDVMPIGAAFAISAAVSLTLVSGYLLLAFGKKFARLAGAAQFAYMVLFSYSFFFDGMTGLTITIGAIVTLAILMVVTAKVNWSEKFAKKPAIVPPAIPKGVSA